MKIVESNDLGVIERDATDEDKRQFEIELENERVYGNHKRVKGLFKRSERNAYLTQSDWTQMSDAPLTTEQRAAWAVYRQALRNVPAQPEFPDNVVWPTPPQ